jgi:chromosome segregation ATPase
VVCAVLLSYDPSVTDSDLTLAVLREIRDEIRSTRTDLKAEISATNERLDATRTELKVEISAVRTELKAELSAVAETLKELAGQQVILTRYISNVVERQEQRLDDHGERLARLEGRGEAS